MTTYNVVQELIIVQGFDERAVRVLRSVVFECFDCCHDENRQLAQELRKKIGSSSCQASPQPARGAKILTETDHMAGITLGTEVEVHILAKGS